MRQIARDTGIHRETVSKYVRAYEKKRSCPMEGGQHVHVEDLIESLTEKPAYKTNNRAKRKSTPEIEQRIRAFLQENREKRYKGQTKQQKTIVDMFEALEAEKVDVGYTVRRTVRQLECRPKEAFIKEVYLPGDVWNLIGGIYTGLWQLPMGLPISQTNHRVLPGSTCPFLRPYTRCSHDHHL